MKRKGRAAVGDNALFALKIKIDCSMIVLRRNNLSLSLSLSLSLAETNTNETETRNKGGSERDQSTKKKYEESA